jgi:uncharacterized protein YndB with AHSA1/START domain
MIERTLLLPCSLERAFELLTEQAGRWWPADRRHTKDANSEIVMEAGGRFFERAADGTEVELGVVRVFEPPTRLVLDWYPGTGRAEPTHVEIVLSAEGASTRLELTHRAGPVSAEAYAKKADAFDRSWALVLAALLAAAAA